jgi:hypothetical protein
VVSALAHHVSSAFRLITSLLVAPRASVIVEVLDTLARRACEICQSKKTSAIGRSSHCTVHPEIMSGDMDSGHVTFPSHGWPELVLLVPVMVRPH